MDKDIILVSEEEKTQIFSQKYMLKVESFQKKKNYRNNNYKSSHKIYICAHTKYSSQHLCVFECLLDIRARRARKF